MKTLANYESVSDQLINKDKSHFMVPANSPFEVINVIGEITTLLKKAVPLHILGAPFTLVVKELFIT